jgi:hypothetical protein
MYLNLAGGKVSPTFKGAIVFGWIGLICWVYKEVIGNRKGLRMSMRNAAMLKRRVSTFRRLWDGVMTHKREMPKDSGTSSRDWKCHSISVHSGEPRTSEGDEIRHPILAINGNGLAGWLHVPPHPSIHEITRLNYQRL